MYMKDLQRIYAVERCLLLEKMMVGDMERKNLGTLEFRIQDFSFIKSN